MAPVVVIGAGGYLGSRLLDDVSQEVAAIGVVRSADEPDAEVADLLEDDGVEAVAEVCRDAIVFYCANVGGRQAAIAAPTAARRINCDVPARLAEVARKFVYFSTDYVFSQPGRLSPDTPCSPDSTYAHTKAAGERRVLAAAPQSLIVRVSGLYDDDGTRGRTFRAGETINASDNRHTTPTYVPDLVRAVKQMVDRDERGIRHVVGPATLSDYEFHQLASLRWGFTVRPVLATERRDGPVLVAEPSGAVRHPTEVFRSPRADHGTELRVFDCVGVLLGARTWKHPDPLLWTAEESRLPQQGRLVDDPGLLADMYAPNWRLWTTVCRAPAIKILANNGKQASFEKWVERYRLDLIFDRTINSERDAAEKPGPAFAHIVHTLAGHRTVTLYDDSREITTGAQRHGWATALAVRTALWPVSAYTCERRTLPWAP
ncbi:sugar nucleotide-binding protein [Nocardia sp. BMG51109]|uniref:SDR family oxidoreductase n=1 Tax=Nocardia sp. BMG51109 TaxID=1056816 RepID=UPI0004B87F9C|nr:sugar nucleotide-binding protein [Nocardia sp. BMG51109]